MKLYVNLALIVALTVLVGAGRAADEKVSLTYKAQVGQTARYKTTGTLSMEAEGQKVSLDMTDTEKVTFTNVAASGDLTMERETESVEASFNGQKVPSSDKDNTKTTVVVHADGTLVSYKSDAEDQEEVKSSARLFPATTPIFTDKPIGPGDKWTRDYKGNADLGTRDAKAEFEAVGYEKVGGIDTVKIKMSYHETEGDKAVRAQGTFDVEKTSGDAVSADLEVENLPFAGGTTANGKLHADRIDGSPLAGAKTGGKASDTKPEPKKDKTIDEIVKDYEKLPGLFTLYRKREAGRETIYLEIKESQLDTLMMMEVTAATGTSSYVVAGDPINDILFKFVKNSDDKIEMRTPNINFRAAEGTPIARAVKRSFADAILDSYKIEAVQPDRKSLLINVSDLFRGDIAQVSAVFSSPLGELLGIRGSSYSLDRDKTYIASLKNFPENLFVQTAYNFSRNGGGGLSALSALFGGDEVLADGRSIPLKVDYNVFALPDNGYRPRLADPRVGYFLTEYQDMNNDRAADTKVRYIWRWQLEKAEPKLALSPPKKPIVFWLDNAIPLEYRDAVREGLLFWNKAFEKVGIKDAIVVKQMPDNADWDHADMRYNVIRWVASPSAGYAVAQARVNPLTGQILNADITVDANFVRYINLERAEMINPAGYFDEPSPLTARKFNPLRCELGPGMREQAWFGHMALDMVAAAGVKIDDKAYVHSYLREVVAHEMGHIMGLRHNFIASTYHTADELKNEDLIKATGCSASVMEYGPFNIFALKQKGVEYYSPTIGPYDIWAIQYGYTPINAKTPADERPQLEAIACRDNEPGHAYESDEIADQFDPAVVTFDLSRDPLTYWQRNLQVSRFMLFHLGEREPKRGESYYEFTRNFQMLIGYYARAASIAERYVGGLHVNRNHRGDTGEKPTLAPIKAEEQKQALHLLNVYVFAENAFAFPKSYYTEFTDRPYADVSAFLFGGNSYPIRDTLSSIQQAALKRLFNTAVMSRVSNNEYKTDDPTKALTLASLFRSVGATCWSELDAHKNIDSLRRRLQRAHLDTMIEMVVNPAPGTPDDAKMLAWDQLRRLQTRIAAARTAGHYDDYTRLHLEESLTRINRALDARQMLGGGQASRSTSILDMLGATPNTNH